MKENKVRKLVLNTRTLAMLSSDELAEAAGGARPTTCEDTKVCETDPACDHTCKSAIEHTIC